MLKKIENHILYKNEKFFSSFPSIALLENNKLLLVFRRARDSRWLLNDSNEESQALKHQVDHIDSRSQLTKIFFDTDFNPITPPEPLPINPEAADQDASLLVLANKDILLSSFSWYPVHSRLSKTLQNSGTWLYGHPDITGCYYISWGGFTMLSKDMGKTWSSHNYLPPLPGANDIIPGKRTSHGGAIRGQAIEVNNEILLPVYKQLSNDTVSSSHLYCSTDSGKSWIYRSVIARDQHQKLSLNEPSLLYLEGDSMIAFLRNSTETDHLVTAFSNNQGHTWEEWQETPIIGHPAHPLRLNDGRIFICYGYRHKPYGIRGHFMDSSGRHFIGDEIVIRDDGYCGDIGYPWAVEMPNGKILVVYYFTETDGIRYIAGSLLSL